MATLEIPIQPSPPLCFSAQFTEMYSSIVHYYPRLLNHVIKAHYYYYSIHFLLEHVLLQTLHNAYKALITNCVCLKWG